ncbi:hypothetical protein [Roseinatronobacter monicus]|uniref:Uncharacterized protein n=1 Tax=Roseinatronobacter monicus TaxID=393481 RepID=A0A543KI81_9RHOB|nr:hypothetical protein [Roseinatronobacter monicus]TQM94789.1 hypothetical protein BD293_3477 [Roseinatronobacter monicus]
MKQTLLAAMLVILAAPLVPAPASAGPLETACLRSDRAQATRAMCRCIDSVAQSTLTRAEQRRAATFFRNPQLAQDVRMSKSDRDNAFWTRYRAFGDAAERSCAGR